MIYSSSLCTPAFSRYSRSGRFFFTTRYIIYHTICSIDVYVVCMLILPIFCLFQLALSYYSCLHSLIIQFALSYYPEQKEIPLLFPLFDEIFLKESDEFWWLSNPIPPGVSDSTRFRVHTSGIPENEMPLVCFVFRVLSSDLSFSLFPSLGCTGGGRDSS